MDSDEEMEAPRAESHLNYLSEPKNEAERRMQALHRHYPNLADPLGSIAMHIGKKYYQARAICIQLGGEVLQRGGYEVLKWPDNDDAQQARLVVGDIDGDMHKFFYMSWHSGFSYEIVYDSDRDEISVVKMLIGPMNPRITYDADVMEGLFRHWKDLLENLDKEARR